MKVALVYDRVNKFGGAERILLALHQIWPQASLFTSVYDPKNAPWAKDFTVIPSFLQKIPLAKQKHEIFPYLMPFAFESFNFDDFDVVISISSAEAKGIITKPKTLHLCYCLTPTRYLWSGYHHYLQNPRFGILNPLVKLLIKPLLKQLKKWDEVSCHRPDYYLAISQTVQKRIKKFYHQNSEIFYPPINTQKFKFLNSKFEVNRNSYLVVGRLVSYKRIDLIIKAFNDLKLPLLIIGKGSEEKKLKTIAGPTIEFITKYLTDDKLISYYQNCRALVYAGVEDFGLVSLEAQACGKPVIALNIGGFGETVIDSKTGILFEKQTVESLIKAIKKFEQLKFDPKACRLNALKYSQENFTQKFKKLVEEKWQLYQKSK